jgi:phosphotransferase system HPr-like phosphotransfer protein
MMEFKKKYNVMLNSLTAQLSVYEVTEKCRANVEAENESDGYSVNAKSVLGFYSLDLKKPVTLTINDENDARLIERALENSKIRYTVVA